jgi:hypothetical protein
MNRIVDEQKRLNEETRGRWELYRSHRQRVTRLLVDSAATGGRLCVLGAGNSNDVDLSVLADHFRRIHLVDLDTGALQSGVSRQGYGDSEKVVVHGDVDVTSMADLLANWTPEHPPSNTDLDACLSACSSRPPLDLPGPFDAVASVCLLTQLLDSVVNTLGERHPRYLEMVMRIRARHLQLLVELLRPGGTGVLVAEFVSSSTFPDLPQIPEPHLPETAAQLIDQRNFFTGMNPFVIRSLFESDPQLAPALESVEMTQPWLWDFGPRVYLVCALIVRRKAT